MPAFTYTGRDVTGKVVSGAISAKDAAEVRDKLRQNHVFLTQLTEQVAEQAKPGGGSLFVRKKVKLDQLVVMSRQLATLVRAGLPIIQSLNEVAEQTENPYLSDIMREVRADVLNGATLAEAMRKHPKLFPDMYTSLVHAGESSGTLEQTLEAAARQFDAMAELREKVKGAMVYPVIVVVSAIGVVFFMLVFIVPAFGKVYTQFGAKLPAITLSLVTMSNLIVNYWWITGATAIAGCFAVRQYLRTTQGRRLLDIAMLKMPLVGKLNRKISVARFCMTFGGAVKAGVPLLRALVVGAQTTGNVIIQDAILKVADSVNEGSTIHAPLEQTGQFPSMMTRMIAAGEQSGNLDEMLEEVNRFYSRDIEYSVNRLTKMMEPLMTIVVGGIVLFVLLALYMPVFTLTQVMHK
jgi:type IV pilus assembly protein PilC